MNLVFCLRGSMRSMSTAAARRPFVGGNWKCNPQGLKEVDSLCDALKSVNTSNVEVCVAPSPIHMMYVKKVLSETLSVASQDVWLKGGAHTGETDPAQISDLGLDAALVGHSERRARGESSELVAQKARAAKDQGLDVIACVGETLEEREGGRTVDVVREQLEAYGNTLENDWSKVVIAYEPVWAIGTGKTASPEQAQEVHHEIRAMLPSEHRDTTRIIYGGSVTADTASDLAAKDDVDGFLVGGASLKPKDFSTIVSAFD